MGSALALPTAERSRTHRASAAERQSRRMQSRAVEKPRWGVVWVGGWMVFDPVSLGEKSGVNFGGCGVWKLLVFEPEGAAGHLYQNIIETLYSRSRGQV